MNWIRFLLILLLLIFIFAFRAEVGLALWVTLENFRGLVGMPSVQEFGPEVFQAIDILRFNFLGFFLAASLMVWLVAAPAVLPLNDVFTTLAGFFQPPADPGYARLPWLNRVLIRAGTGLRAFFRGLPNFLFQVAQHLWQRLMTGMYLWLSVFGMVGQVVFIRNGQVLEDPSDTRRGLPGVVVVDFNSAAILELQHPPPTLVGFILNLVSFIILGLLRLVGFQTWRRNQRIIGAGLHFTVPLERIRSAADLRRQTRSEMRVRAYTRDGIEVETIVWSIFTLGIEPDQFGIQVTYNGRRQPDNVQVINLDDLPNGHVRVRFDRFSNYRLDQADRDEIGNARPLPNPYTPAPDPRQVQPPAFNPARVFAALSSQPLTFQPGSAASGLLPWQDMPLRVSKDIYREMISQVNFDDLYQPQENPAIPVPVLRQRFAARLQSYGLRSYRLVVHRRGQALQDGQEYDSRELIVSDFLYLNNPKPLRDRGILVIASGFTELMAVNQQIYEQRLDNWRVRWDSDTSIERASHEREAMRARALARSQAQRDLFNAFSQIYQARDHSEEIMAIRLLQAMEGITADPTVNNLVPGDTLNLMRSLHSLLLPDKEPPLLPPVHTEEKK